MIEYNSLEEELQALANERELERRKNDSRKNKLISEIQSVNKDEFLTLKKRKKSFLQKLLSVFK